MVLRIAMDGLISSETTLSDALDIVENDTGEISMDFVSEVRKKAGTWHTSIESLSHSFGYKAVTKRLCGACVLLLEATVCGCCSSFFRYTSLVSSLYVCVQICAGQWRAWVDCI